MRRGRSRLDHVGLINGPRFRCRNKLSLLDTEVTYCNYFLCFLKHLSSELAICLSGDVFTLIYCNVLYKLVDCHLRNSLKEYFLCYEPNLMFFRRVNSTQGKGNHCHPESMAVDSGIIMCKGDHRTTSS